MGVEEGLGRLKKIRPNPGAKIDRGSTQIPPEDCTPGLWQPLTGLRRFPYSADIRLSGSSCRGVFVNPMDLKIPFG